MMMPCAVILNEVKNLEASVAVDAVQALRSFVTLRMTKREIATSLTALAMTG